MRWVSFEVQWKKGDKFRFKTLFCRDTVRNYILPTIVCTDPEPFNYFANLMQIERQTNRHEHPITYAFDALCAEDALRIHFNWSSWPCYFRYSNQNWHKWINTLPLHYRLRTSPPLPAFSSVSFISKPHSRVTSQLIVLHYNLKSFLYSSDGTIFNTCA